MRQKNPQGKESSQKMATKASKVMRDKNATDREKSLAACVLANAIKRD